MQAFEHVSEQFKQSSIRAFEQYIIRALKHASI